MQVKLELLTEASSIVQKEWPNSTCLIADKLAGRAIPVNTSYLVLKVYVKLVTNPTGSV